jgi:hypothetical protein
MNSALVTTPVSLVVQTTEAPSVAGQPEVLSPSETVSVSAAIPAAVQVKVGLCAVALLSVPALAVHW